MQTSSVAVRSSDFTEPLLDVQCILAADKLSRVSVDLCVVLFCTSRAAIV